MGWPLAVMEVRCEYAAPPRRQSHNAMELAVAFYRESCVGCPHRDGTGVVPNLTTEVAKRDAELEQRQQHEQQRTEQLAARRAARHTRRRLTVAGDGYVVRELADVIDRLDTDDRVEGSPAMTDASRQLVQSARRAPELFSRTLVESMLEMAVDTGEPAVFVALGELVRAGRCDAREAVQAALAVLSTAGVKEAADLLAAFPESLHGEDLPPVLDRLVELAAGQDLIVRSVPAAPLGFLAAATVDLPQVSDDLIDRLHSDDDQVRADAALVCVPPYHIAGIIAALSNLYAGRKMVYLANFDAEEWVRLVNAEAVTTATVVPTMLDRIVKVLEASDHQLPTLCNLAYGGSKVGLPLVRKALQLLPGVGFVNAYGLTETSSTIAVLTPEDHRAALGTTNEALARRLGSVGQPVPGVEVQIRDQSGAVLGPGETGELYVRGEQVSGRYTGIGSVLDEQGWLPTRDIATLDADGYLFLGGRSDDTIIRGGENIAPAELEDVLVEHRHVHEVAVVGADDPEWGQAIVAVVVPVAGITPDPEELREYVRKALRGSRTPDRVVFRDELPTNATGKVLRREIVASLNDATAGSF